MAMPLLTTKLCIPPARSELVLRPRLVERLNAGVGRKLTLVSAPAGFGKTTLLGQWATGLGWPIGWLTLDESDNDATRFWAYCIAALQSIAEVGKAAMAELQSPQAPAAEPLLVPLINEIAQLPEPIVLVLDDYHVIVDEALNRAVAFLVENMPPQLHLVLSGRADPPWPLARLRARGEMSELRAEDLRFTLQESAAFLNEVMGLGLPAEHLAALEGRTEGWVAGLQMAALSVRGRVDRANFVEAFGGTHRFVLDYLVEEVLQGQPPAIQGFLLQTCILERMSAALCDTVTEGAGSLQILDQLERANLFVLPLDGERRWYRYHRLFADLLRSRLKQTRPSQEGMLHRRASAWYADHGLITEAVSHALAAGDTEQVARLVEGNALTMMGHGELTTVQGWLDALPDEMVRRRPWLSIARAWALLYAGNLDALEPLLQDAEQSWQAWEPHDQVAHLEGHVAAIRAEAAYVQGQMSRTAVLAQEAMDRLPADDSMARGFAAAHLGYALYGMGDLGAADRALADAYAIARGTGDSHVAVMILCDAATVQIDRGQLHRAADTALAALQLAEQYAGRRGQRPPSSGHAHTSLSRVLLEWNDLATALQYAEEGNELCRLWRQPETLATSYANLARVQLALGHKEEAFEAMHQARRLATDLPTWIEDRVSAQEAVVCLAAGDLRAAGRWARASGLTAHDRPGFQERFLYQALARVLIGLGRAQSDASLLDDAVGLLAHLREDADAALAMGSVITTLVLEAMALQAQDRMAPALVALERALSLAQPEGYVRTFIDEGLPMGQLLRQALARGIGVDYVRKLLDALETGVAATDSASAARAALVEPLSERELEILRLLTTHLSSTEMAQELVISVNTVRSHIKNIYGKLGVHSRGKAVARAQELNLL